MMNRPRRIVVVSNRLPVVLSRRDDGGWSARPGSGGLVTALTPVLRRCNGLWIGWPGIAGEPDLRVEEVIREAGSKMGMMLSPIELTGEEVSGFYHGFSNEILWPLFHDLVAGDHFDGRYWSVYQQVNAKVARLVARLAEPSDFIWIQDYHFLTAAVGLRCLGVSNPLGFFLHTPFPAPDMFLRLPWREQILGALLEFDLIGFQCPRDRRNFIECVEALRAAEVEETRRSITLLRVPKRRRRAHEDSTSCVRVGSFPISIDYESFNTLALSERVRRVAARLANQIGRGLRVLLGVDRLDYTKGLPHKIRAFARSLECYPELREKITLVQHVVPSRECLPQYRALRLEIEQLVGEVNGKYGTRGWVPVRYFYHTLEREDLAAFYRLADVLLVTSLKDGMNLVSKEYCASCVDGNGVLVLSEFAGSSTELGPGALLVNPYDSDGLARAIRDAVLMSGAVRRRRMMALRTTVRERDVFQWVDRYLEAAESPEAEVTPAFESLVPGGSAVRSAWPTA
ncbi:MAG: alpha,alpha-trehalose-phosphate synthase (UDP-forming) [Vicinamibacteria bacterium]